MWNRVAWGRKDIKETQKFYENELRLWFHCYFLIPMKCPHTTLFQHTVPLLNQLTDLLKYRPSLPPDSSVPELEKWQILREGLLFDRKICRTTAKVLGKRWVSTRVSNWFECHWQKFKGKTFQATHERFLILDCSCDFFFVSEFLPNKSTNKSTKFGPIFRKKKWFKNWSY